MKLVVFFILVMFLPEFATGQETAPGENTGPLLNDEQAAAPQAGHYQQIAYAGPADISIIEMNARYSRAKFTAVPDLYSEMKQYDHSEPGVIGDWRERVFKTLGTYSGPRQPDLVNDGRLSSNNELDARANEKNAAMRLVLKETLKFAQERLPEIDKLVKALKLEVSTDIISGENAGPEADDKKTGEARAVKNPVAEDKLSLRTGLRVPVESGRLSLISETEAGYGSMSSFFKMNLDGKYDHSFGLVYVLGRELHLRVERQVTHTADPVTGGNENEKSDLNLVQLVCQF